MFFMEIFIESKNSYLKSLEAEYDFWLGTEPFKSEESAFKFH